MRKNNLIHLFSTLSLFSISLSAQVNLCQAGKAASAASVYYSAENLRSDTFNILKYVINLEAGDATSLLIGGSTNVRFVPKMNGRTFIRLDLLKLVMDSVRENNTLLSYVYNDTILKVNFAAPKNTGDTSLISIFYHGQPQTDASGWGGFYFDNTQGAQYAFNLGVGFAAKPHNYGRVWFPCFDNFVERSKYEFNITSDTSRKAYCNGQLISDLVNGSKRTRKWILNEEIPTYLASVAVAKYTQVNWTINALNGVKPITLVSHPNDTSAMKAGFANLKSCIQGFENYFGPYMWNRFGYCLVPFGSGAMEHATSITYPRNAIGSLAYEDLMSHELSHHWFGDLITCETPEDMWINEGMASFCAFMFAEWQYGHPNYLSKVKVQHDALLHFLHKNEGGFRAISGVPHTYTYGDHVYKKGSDVAHTMRGYLGDSAFFAGLKYALSQKAFQSINSNEFRDLIATGSGKSMTDFFNNWVFSGGWSHFSIDSVRVSPATSGYNAQVSLRQKLFGATTLHSNVPLEVSFFDAAWNRTICTVTMSGSTSSFTANIPVQPVYCALNFDGKINDATTHDSKVIKNTGIVNFTLPRVLLNVQNKGADSSLVRIIHNYVKPDELKQNPAGHHLSDQHFWKVEGIFSPGFVARARFSYDGNKGLSAANAYMDTLLTIVNGDSLELFYREDAGRDWQWLKKAVKTKVGSRIGYIETDTLKRGEYTFANLGDTTLLAIRDAVANGTGVMLYPNPAMNSFTLKMKQAPPSGTLLNVTSMEGKLMYSGTLSGRDMNIDLSGYKKGAYMIDLRTSGKLMFSQKLIVE